MSDTGQALTRSALFLRLARAVFLVLRLSSLCLTTVGMRQSSGAPGHAPAQVSVIKIEPKDTPIVVEFVGQTQSSHQVEIRARVNGFLDKRTYTEGSPVKAGQVMFRMDPKPFQAQLDAAQGALAQQQARLRTARANLARVKPLVEQDALSQKDLDDATGQEQAAAAAVESAKANVEQARLNLGYTTIMHTGDRAFELRPRPGRRLRQPGEQPSHLRRPGRSNLGQLQRVGERCAQVPRSGRAGPDSLAEGRGIRGGGRARGRLDISAEGPHHLRRRGVSTRRQAHSWSGPPFRTPEACCGRASSSARTSWAPCARTRSLVPQRAVQQGAKGHFVWVVSKEGKAEPRPVVVGDWRGMTGSSPRGFIAGDRVVVDGGLSLRPGEPVTVKAEAPATESAPAGAHRRQTPAKPKPPRATNKGGSETMFSRFFIERPIFATVVSLSS